MLIPVQYHTRKYPAHINPSIDEIAGHFDVHEVNANREFSLHTEYSYGRRKLNSALLKGFKTLPQSHREGVPQLWRSEAWAEEFAEFVKSLCDGNAPTVIEIHPPFSDYTETIERFLEIYKIFEESILTYFPQTMILIENRSGSIYKCGRFLISRGQHLRDLCEHVSANNLKLRIAMDVPQLLTAYGGPQRLTAQAMGEILNRQKILQSMTDGIHLWGKRKNGKGRTVSHSGELNTYFESEEKKGLLGLLCMDQVNFGSLMNEVMTLSIRYS